MEQQRLLAFFGHHKCATTWVLAIVQNAAENLGLTWGFVHDTSSFNDFLKNDQHQDFLIDVNAVSSHLELLPEFVGFHLIRDPRDIVVSGYYSHLYSHPEGDWLGDHRAQLKKASKEEGLFLEMEFAKWNFNCLATWDYSNKKILELKMEDLIGNPYEIMVGAFKFLGLVADDEVVEKGKALEVAEMRGILYDHRFSKKSGGRPPGQEDEKHHYRKGIAGDWENHFSEAHKEFFKENFNDILLKLGYEQDGNW